MKIQKLQIHQIVLLLDIARANLNISPSLLDLLTLKDHLLIKWCESCQHYHVTDIGEEVVENIIRVTEESVILPKIIMN